MAVREGRPKESRQALEQRIAKLERINAVLIDRVERSIDRQGSAFSLFQTAIGLEAQVRSRTQELTEALRSLERTNAALAAAKEEAERANLSKTRFLAAASHDLLQPLNAARLFMSTLVDLQAEAEARRVAVRVERSLQTIEDLIRALLDISKLDAGLVRPSVQEFPLDGCLAALDSTFRPAAERKGLRLRLRPTPVTVRSDPVMLQRILQNLLSNAVRYTRRGGVHLGVRRQGEDCVIQVADTGIGIPEREYELIFEEFHRGALTEEEDVALGLGLAIVRRQLRTLGHGLEFRSKVGVGSVFRLRLPLAAGLPAAPEPGPDRAGSRAPGGIAGTLLVLIENDEPTLTAMTQLLDRWDCHVLPVRSRDELQRLAPQLERRPDIVITDYHLDDGVDGLSLIARLRRDFRAALPAIVVSADHSEAVAAAARAAGCEMLRKPVRPAALRALLVHLLSAAPAMAESG
ncbi:NahK/ErcS family hybrid sensor histidine kinase/response regulator [Paracraurococcus lichenis]|uniref:histidine kinase n=1 Tax=Paracraurococcus lichenis TaxID=3064888 RepID=A0ABT9E0P5_9PROT|nr:NahK/ErcS family hybrid sensor histidine kinase/response regulator [Paracraurococcus sp. LOR1-02]MDO9709731.1 NahK/ErcS family hybrid sensor histidine kinase/response regulator [Paracraurococcus sp. LOR1-02]